MKIIEVRTRALQWKGKTVPLPPHFCTNPMDAVSPLLSKDTMSTFTFHGWLLVEIFTDNGLVGIGNQHVPGHAFADFHELLRGWCRSLGSNDLPAA